MHANSGKQKHWASPGAQTIMTYRTLHDVPFPLCREGCCSKDQLLGLIQQGRRNGGSEQKARIESKSLVLLKEMDDRISLVVFEQSLNYGIMCGGLKLTFNNSSVNAEHLTRADWKSSFWFLARHRHTLFSLPSYNTTSPLLAHCLMDLISARVHVPPA